MRVAEEGGCGCGCGEGAGFVVMVGGDGGALAVVLFPPAEQQDCGNAEAANAREKGRGAGAGRLHEDVAQHADQDRDDAAQRGHPAEHAAEVETCGIEPAPVAVGDHPRFEHAEEEGGAHAAEDAAEG